MSELTDNQVVDALLHAVLAAEPTEAEIQQFITEFDEGKHPLTDKEKDALATGGFRQYLKATNQITTLTAERDGLLKDKARLDWLEQCHSSQFWQIEDAFNHCRELRPAIDKAMAVQAQEETRV